MKKILSFFVLSSLFCWHPSNLNAQTDPTKNRSPFSMEVSYVGNSVTNIFGGIKQGSVYLGLANLKFSFSTEDAGWWKGGEVFLNAANTHGGLPSATLVGDFQGVSNIEAGDLTYMHELWFRQKIGSLCVIVGLQDMNTEFAESEFSGIFFNGSFGIHSTVANNVPAPIFPLTALGVQLQWEINNDLTAKMALFDGLPDDFATNPYNLEWSVQPNEGYLAVSEFSYHQKMSNGLDGTYKLGGYFHNHVCHSEVPNEGCITSDYGFYLLADQVCFRSSDGRQLALFVQAGLSPNRINQNWNYLGFGLNVTGLFKSRPEDVFGLAIARAGFNNPANRMELALEATYHLGVNEYLFIQPDLQYIVHPASFDENLANAFVGSFRVGIVF